MRESIVLSEKQRSQIEHARKNRANLYTAAKNVLASRSATNQRTLGRLGRNGNQEIKQRIAENVRTDTGTLCRLALDANADIRSAVAENPSTPRDVLEHLARDLNADVRYSMAENTHTSSHLLKQLATDENPYVQDRARRTHERILADVYLHNDLETE